MRGRHVDDRTTWRQSTPRVLFKHSLIFAGKKVNTLWNTDNRFWQWPSYWRRSPIVAQSVFIILNATSTFHSTWGYRYTNNRESKLSELIDWGFSHQVFALLLPSICRNEHIFALAVKELCLAGGQPLAGANGHRKDFFQRGSILDFFLGSQKDFCMGGQKWWRYIFPPRD